MLVLTLSDLGTVTYCGISSTKAGVGACSGVSRCGHAVVQKTIMRNMGDLGAGVARE